MQNFKDNHVKQNPDYPQTESHLAGTPYEKWQYSINVEWDNRGGYSGAGGIHLPGGDEGGSYMEYTINNPREWKYLKFSGHMRTENVVKRDKLWTPARLLLFFKDAQNKPYWDHPHALCSLYGNHEWKKYTRVFPVPDYAVSAHLVAQNRSKSGSAWFDELSVVGVARKNGSLWINMTAGLVWITVIILLIHVTGTWRLNYNWAVMGLIVLIVIGVIMPQPLIDALAEKSKGLIITGPKDADQKHSSKFEVSAIDNENRDPAADSGFESPVGTIKSAGHFALFALICFFLNLSYKDKNYLSCKSGWTGGPAPSKNEKKKAIETVPVLSIGLGLALFAGATEALQFITETRTPLIQDWLFDLAGIIAGVIMYGIYTTFKDKGSRRKERG